MAIAILVRNPNAEHQGCRILYRDVGDYLTRSDKLARLRDWRSTAGISDWLEIRPDRHNDWIDQRDEAFTGLYPMGSKQAKAGVADEAIFNLFSNGFKTGRDTYLFNFSPTACAKHAEDTLAADNSPPEVRDDRGKYKTDAEQRDATRPVQARSSAQDPVRAVPYRPFVKQYCYLDYALLQRKYQQDVIFPAADTENRAICVPAIGSRRPFSALVVDSAPDLHFVEEACQCFPRFRFNRKAERQGRLLVDDEALERLDNIPDSALRAFRVHYQNNGVTKDDIFDYVYGILHAPTYRVRFANDLTKDIPRVPFVPDFRAFAEAGRRLGILHLTYETCPEYPLGTVFDHQDAPRPEHFRLGRRPMRFTDEQRSTLRVNDHLCLHGIPPEAHLYEVNGRSPLEWFIDRYRIRQDRHSGIVNDPNDWFERPEDLTAAIRRIVYVSVKTVSIVATLPEPFANDPTTKAISQAEAHRQSHAVANSPGAQEDQDFVDAIAAPWTDE